MAEDNCYKTRLALYDDKLMEVGKALQGKSLSLFIEMAMKHFLKQCTGQNLVNLLLLQSGKPEITFENTVQAIPAAMPVSSVKKPEMASTDVEKEKDNQLIEDTMGDFK